MIVTCDNCGAGFNVNDSLIKPQGSKVRCSKCRHVFLVTAPGTAAPAAAAAAAASPDAVASPDGAVPSGADAGAAAEPAGDDVDARLDDIFGAEQAEAPASELGELSDLGDISDLGDVSDLDLDSAELSAEGGEESLELELDLPGAGAPPPEAEAAEAEGAPAEKDDLAELDGDAELQALLAEAGDGDDLDITLTADADMETTALPQLDELLDLSEEDLTLDEGELAGTGLIENEAEAPEGGQGPLELSEDLEIAEATSTAAAADDDDGDEIDLSDIEQMINGDQSPAPGGRVTADAAAEDEEELDLSEFAFESPEEGAGGEAEDVVELELEMADTGQPAPEPATDGPAPATDELDFSDLGDILAEDSAPAPKEGGQAGGAEEELELDLDLEGADDGLRPAGDGRPEGDELDLDSLLGDQAGEGDEALDFTLELDEEHGEATTGGEEPAPEVEIDLGSDIEDMVKETGRDDDLEINLLDDEEDTLATTAAVTGTISGQSPEADAEVIGATTDDFATEDFADASDLTAEEAVELTADERPRRVVPKLLATVLVLLVLLAAAIVVPPRFGVRIPYLSDIQIPYLSAWLGGAATEDPGNLKIVPLSKTIEAKFVDNRSAGQLLVISGQVRNDYNHPRSFIQVAGKLYKKDGSVAKSATVYAGNVVSTLELTRLDPAQIHQRLQDKFGQRRANLNIMQGRVVPFMIVFDQLPEGLEEYTVEVVGSARN